jgi:protein AIR1/2
MAAAKSNSGDFISILSSEDERPLPKKRRSPNDSPTSNDGPNASTERSKRARMSSASADSITGAKVSEEGEIDEDFESEVYTPDTGSEGKRSGDSASGAVFLPRDPPVYTNDSLSLQLPVFSQQREGSWPTRFKEWVQLLYTANSSQAAELTPTLIRAAYAQYIDIHSRLKSNKKRSAKSAVESLEDAYLAQLLAPLRPATAHAQQTADGLNEPQGQADVSGQLQTPSHNDDRPTTSNGQPDKLAAQAGSVFVVDVNPQPQLLNSQKQQPEPQPTKNAMPPREGVPSGTNALQQQHRYFPSAADPSSMCLLCGRDSHTADSCTNDSCKFCGKNGHWDYACTSIKLRCRKCNQLGHKAASCTEKLALTKQEGLACSYCNSPDHLETECTEIWRSFHPETGTIKTVTALPVSCSICGSAQHFASDCRQRQDSAPNPTWSLANKSQYVDPECSSVAICSVAEPASNQQSDLRIRGHASRTNAVHYSEGEDSDDVEFLGHRAAAPKPVRTGRITVSANLHAPNGNQQPPLPPGPPPPLPPHPSNRRPPSTARQAYSQGHVGSSLPARPPASSRDYSSVPPPPPASGRGGRGGGRNDRGGRGGRGGGRGYRGGKFRGGKY